MPVGVRASAGKSLPRSPIPPPEQRIGDCMERHVTVRMAGQARGAFDPQATQRQRLARPEGMAVCAKPDSSPSGKAGIAGRSRTAGHKPTMEEGASSFEIDRHGHLEVGRSPGIA